MKMQHTKLLAMFVGVLILLGTSVVVSAGKETEECTQELIGLATCLPYVGGGDHHASSPTPDCCNGLKQVMKTNKKCLCVVVKDRNDPDLGLNINATLALALPSVCHVPADVSKCPSLLHMDPNSPEAQVFYQFSSTPVPAPSVQGAGSGSIIGTSSGGGFNTEKKYWILLALHLLISCILN